MRNLTVSVLASGLLIGCGSKAAAPISNTATATPSGKDRLPCPTGDALHATAAQYFAAGATVAAGDLGATCVAVYTDRALWVLDGWHQSPTEDGVALVTALVDPAAKQAVWTSGAGDFSYPSGAVDRMIGAGMTAVDLDGDGGDELVNISGSSAQGYETASLSILTIGPEGLNAAGEIPFTDDNSAADPDPADAQSCSTEWKLVAGPDGAKHLDLTVTASTPQHGGCLAPGHHVMRWTGTELVEVK